LKKSSNNEVFDHIRIDFLKEIDGEDFRARNAEHFKGVPTKLDTSVEKLRQKFKWLKMEWANHTQRAKNGSGLEPDKEPHWYQILDPVFSETHKPLNLVSKAADTSFVGDVSSEEDDDDLDNPSNSINSSSLDREIMAEDEDEKQDSSPESPATGSEIPPPPKKKSKFVAPAHKKAEKIKSTAHGLSAIARGIQASIIAQDKRFERQLKENSEKEKRLLEFRAVEAEKDRKHEERMAQLLLSMRSTQQAATAYPTWGGMGPSSSFVSPSQHQRSWGGQHGTYGSPPSSTHAHQPVHGSYTPPLSNPYEPVTSEPDEFLTVT
jgi:hypothetical protein